MAERNATAAQSAAKAPGQVPEAAKKTEADAVAAETTRQKATQKAAGADKTLQVAEEKATLAMKKAREAMLQANVLATQEKAPLPFSQKDIDDVAMPRPEATPGQVKDGFDAHRPDPKAKERLSGTRDAPSPEEAAGADARKIRAAKYDDLGYPNTLRALGHALKENKNPDYQKALIRELKPDLQAVSKSLGASVDDMATRDTWVGLSGISKGLPQQAQKDIADAVAAGAPEGRLFNNSGTAEGIRAALDSGNGAFAVNLADSLAKAGRKEEARGVVAVTTDRVAVMAQNFERESKKIEGLQARLANLVNGFGPGMSPEQRQKAVNAFQAKHREEFERYEKSAKGFTGALDASKALKNTSLPVDGIEELKAQADAADALWAPYSQTEAGKQKLAEELRYQAEDEPSVFDQMTELAKKGKDATDFATKLSAATGQAMGIAALGKLGEADPEGARKVIDTLKKNHGLFGISPSSAETLAPLYDSVLKGEPRAVEKLRGTFESLTNARDAGFGTPGGKAALGGLGTFFGAVGALKDAKDVVTGEAEISDAVKLLGDSVSIGAEGVLAGFEAANRAASSGQLANVARLAGKFSAIGGFIGAFGDGVGALDAFKQGNLPQGFAKTAAASGGAILAAAAFSAAAGAQVVPVWGQIVGGVLAAGGALGSLLLEDDDQKAAREDTRDFLAAGGINPSAAEKLSQLGDDGLSVGFFINQVAIPLKTSPRELLQKLQTLPAEKLEAFVKLAQDTPHDERGVYTASDSTPGDYKRRGQVGGRFAAAYTYNDIRSLADAVQFLRDEKLA
ncbi:hypothetical protein ACN47A_39460 [Myxococcus fulvus]|uniref:hypothetical protein n=1 Tax=Myxococcus fulvus TaxID=33 RepID=UPI003B9CE9F5